MAWGSGVSSLVDWGSRVRYRIAIKAGQMLAVDHQAPLLAQRPVWLPNAAPEPHPRSPSGV